MKSYIENGLTKEDRKQLQDDIASLRPYILALKKRDLKGLKCEMCNKIADNYDIHHLKYTLDVSYIVRHLQIDGFVV